MGCRRPPKLLIKGDKLRPELLRQPEVARVIGGEAGLQGQRKSAGMINCDLLDAEPTA